MSDKPDVHTTRFYCRNGETCFWEERMNLSRLFRKGDVVMEKGITYIVHRVALADGVQIVNFTKEAKFTTSANES